MGRQALQQQLPMARQSQNLAPGVQVMLHSPVSPEVGLGALEPWVAAALSRLCLLHSEDFVTTCFVGFSNDSQTWVMYTNGYEEMVGARELLGSHVWTWEDPWEGQAGTQRPASL